MTSEASRQKKSASSTKSPDGDPRKKTRNRTTQSCMNCHTSKRMCDRRRPACSRCVQLGLIGLCVYEVDDPSQGTKTSQDDSARLIKRVAELESVIRELKNKPTPRWAQGSGIESSDVRSSGPGHDERLHTGFNVSPSPESSLPASSYGFQESLRAPISQLGESSTSSGTLGYSAATSSFTSSTNPPRAPGTPPDLTTAFSGLAFDNQFMPVNLETMQNNSTLQSTYSNMNHCGCLQESTNYRTMLELSLGLRRATDVLGQSPGHRHGGFCALHQRLLELDSYAMDSLTPPTSWHGSPSTPGPTAGSANQEAWHAASLNANSPTLLDDVDPFMSWSPRRP